MIAHTWPEFVECSRYKVGPYCTPAHVRQLQTSQKRRRGLNIGHSHIYTSGYTKAEPVQSCSLARRPSCLDNSMQSRLGTTSRAVCVLGAITSRA